jgi:serine/threonine protein kinase
MPGDIVRIGNTRLQFVDDSSEEDTLPPQKPAPSERKAKGKPGAAPPTAVDRDTVVYQTPVAKPARWYEALVGQKFSSYKLGSVLAKGHCGFVFHARDTRKNTPVVVKVLEPEFGNDEAGVKRFVAAMKAVLPLRHPNLVTVFSAGKTGQHCWIAMEYVPGESLAAVIGRIETPGMLDWRHVLRFAIYITRALEYAHGKKFVHRHITPQNILLGSQPKDTKLADLMLSRAVEGELTRDISRNEELVGDAPFLCPERSMGGRVLLDGRADIYGLGATLYAMLTGHPPFEGGTVAEVLAKVRQEQPLPLKKYNLGLPAELEKIIEKMMAKLPADRYGNSSELLKALEGLAVSQSVS